MAQRWLNVCRFAGLMGWLALSPVLAAQTTATAAADSASCLARIPPTEMTRAGVYLTVAIVVPVDTTRKLALSPALAMSRAAAWHARDLLGASGDGAPSAEPVITWRNADGTLRITVHRAGRMSFARADSKPMAAGGGAALLWSGITAALDAGIKFQWPAALTSDSIVFDLELDSETPERGAPARPRADGQEPVFTVMTPWIEPTREVRSPRISYPAAVPAHRVAGAVQLTFVVDSTGHPLLETLKDARPTARSGLTRPAARYYDAFIEAVRRGLGSARYTPARVGGCPIKIWVTQRFEFKPALTDRPPDP